MLVLPWRRESIETTVNVRRAASDRRTSEAARLGPLLADE